MMTDDHLLAFLRARLDEDEALARACDPGPWEWADRGHSAQLKAGGPDFPVVLEADQSMKRRDEWAITDSPNLQHIARHGPARVLVEVEAKKELLDQFETLGSGDNPLVGYTVHVMLRLLALPYAPHPDYRMEWRF